MLAGFSLVVVRGLLIALASLVEEHRLEGPWLGSCDSWALSTGSVVVAHRLSCCAAIWDLLRSGIEPVSPALAGRFFTTDTREATFVIVFLNSYFIDIQFIHNIGKG